MLPVVRIYTSEQNGLDAAREAEQAGFARVYFLAQSDVAGQEQEAVRSAVEAQCIASGQSRACIEALQRGESVVGVYAPFGRGLEAAQILDRHGPASVVERPSTRNPAPFSDSLGIPVLAKWSPMTELSIFQYSFGAPRVSRNPAPLSSRIGLKLLTTPKRKTSSMGLPLLSKNPAPLSSLLRLPLLSRPKGKSTSFGLPLLSGNPTPLSSLFGMRVISKKKNEQDRS